MTCPVRITNDYAEHVARGDPGVDYGSLQGTPLYAPERIRVEQNLHVRRPDGSPSYGGYLVVQVLTGAEKGSRYGFAHLSSRPHKPGTILEPGDMFARTGGTPGTRGAGNSNGQHLHVNRWDRRGRRTDPTGTPFIHRMWEATMAHLSEDQQKQLANLLASLEKRDIPAGKVGEHLRKGNQRLENLTERVGKLEKSGGGKIPKHEHKLDGTAK